jgi:hypothetical protein
MPHNQVRMKLKVFAHASCQSGAVLYSITVYSILGGGNTMTKDTTNPSGTTAAGFVSPKTVAAAAVFEAAKVEAVTPVKPKTTTVMVASGGYAYPATVPVLEGEALKAQQQKQHAQALRQADKLNTAYRARRAKTFSL